MDSDNKPKKRFPFIKVLGGTAILTSLFYLGDKCDVTENTAKTFDAIKKNAFYIVGRIEKKVYGATSTDPEEFLENLRGYTKKGDQEFKTIKDLPDVLEEYKEEIASGEFEESLPELETILKDSIKLIEQYRSPESKAAEIEAANPSQEFKDKLNALTQTLPPERLDSYLYNFVEDSLQCSSPSQKKELVMVYTMKSLGYAWDRVSKDFFSEDEPVLLESEEIIRLRQASGTRLDPLTLINLELNEIAHLPDQQRRFAYQEIAKTLTTPEQFNLLEPSYPGLAACLKTYTNPPSDNSSSPAGPGPSEEGHQTPEKSLQERLQDNVDNLKEMVFPKKNLDNKKI